MGDAGLSDLSGLGDLGAGFNDGFDDGTGLLGAPDAGLFSPQIPTAETEASPQLPSETVVVPDAVPLIPLEPAVAVSRPFGAIDIDIDSDNGSLLQKNPAAIFSSGTWERNGRWYTRQEFVMLLRSEPRLIALGQDIRFSGSGLIIPFNNTDASLGFDGGARITLGRLFERDRHGNDRSVEYTFTGLFDWSSSARFTALQAGTLNTVLGATSFSASPGFDNALTQNYVASSSMDSHELNFRLRQRPDRDQLVVGRDGQWVRQTTPGRMWSVLGGVRYIGLDESFLYQSRSETAGDEDGDAMVDTSNNLIGFQIGLDFTDYRTSWSWGLYARLGGLLNSSDRTSLVSTTISNVDSARSDFSDDNSLAFLGATGVFLNYKVTPSISLRASYDVLFISGVALASENVGVAEDFFPFLNTHGNALYQGLSCGFEMTW